MATVPQVLISSITALGLHLSDGRPVEKFIESDPALILLRTERRSFSSAAECAEKLKKLGSADLGDALPEAAAERPEALDRAWSPWTDADDAVRDCDDFPCKVKLAEAEVKAMKETPEDGRRTKFESLALARAERYEKDGTRSEYEFPGDPLDPWAWLKVKKVDPALDPLKSSRILQARRLSFSPASAPERLRPIRQILDLRRATGKHLAGYSARDAYTAHYFDAWGEWFWAECVDAGKDMQILQGLFVEFDLLKKNDLLSKISRPRMRREIRENGEKYLEAARRSVFGDGL